jgi:uncharacterized protein YecT (DUF1311 family)
VERRGLLNKRAWLALLFVGLALTPPCAQAQSHPSFDCRKATWPVEKLICSDPKLGELDRKMAEAFYRALEKAPVADRGAILKRQLAWLQARANACGLASAEPGFPKSLEASPASCVQRMYARWLEYPGGRITTPSPQQIETPFAATRQPFLPHLLVSRDAELCEDFQNALRKDFLARHRNGESLYKEPPMALGHWMAWPSDLEGLGIDVVEADLDQNGHKQLLIHAAQLVGWRTGYSLVISPDTSTDGLMEELADRVKSQPDDQTPRRYKDVEPGNWAEFEGRGSPIRVLAYRGGLYLYGLSQGVFGGEGYGIATLRKIHADASVELRCQASIAPPTGTLPMPWPSNRPDGRSVPVEVLAWMQTVHEIQGDEGRAPGTMHSLANLIHSSWYTWYDALVRPWEVAASPPPYQLPAAAMRAWIERTFGVTNGQEAAAAATDSILSASFVVSGQYGAEANRLPPKQAARHAESNEWDDTSRRLRTALLVGTTPDEIEALIKDGAILAGKKAWGTTSPEPALFYALEHPDEVAQLLDQGADINEGNAFGKTALMYAAHYDLDATVALLLAHGADVNKRTNDSKLYDTMIQYDGRTALMYAAENASEKVIRQLIQAGSDTCASDTGKRDIANYLSRNRRLSDEERERVAALITADPCHR